MFKLKNVHHLSIIIILIWIITFYLQERYITKLTIHKCNWSKLEEKGDQKNILIIADPQLIDNHTYPGRNELLLSLSKHTVDQYLKKNYNVLISHLNPDKIVFLGDLLDNGRDSTDSYFKHEVKRFNGIFHPDEDMILNVPGNHDIGFGDLINLKNRQRFFDTFGESNRVMEYNDWDLIFLDSPSYSSTKEEINTQARQFISNFQISQNPRILFTHVPLQRESSICGPLRESKGLDINGHGYQYQNTIAKELSAQILDNLKPNLIFTGDDHDYCEIIHKETDSREITVKSISMAMGIKYPAVQLLSINKSEYSTVLCYLQTPYINVANYIILAIISSVLIFYFNLKQRSVRYNYTSILPMSTVTIGSEHSKKIRNFLKAQDNDDADSDGISTYSLPSSIPQYTFTQKKESFINSNSRFGRLYILNKKRLITFLRKWNLVAWFKQNVILGFIVIGIYYFGFSLTL
ncbi:unnamed protein product [Candida verbasci]|uniref:Calcineurin-like phosphoesterase domain-containing protein n=1 Tax=Candida verbasci TaxID=1227364 RepID=A0A9W4TZD8_9ASCO|nr:unnamed protein product [Candida verbasci]